MIIRAYKKIKFQIFLEIIGSLTYANIFNMLYIVLATMLMYLIHLMLPTLLTFKNNPDFSNVRQLIERDTNIPNYVVRIHAATENLKESLPVFLHALFFRL